MDVKTIVGSDGLARCSWCGDDPLYVAYHDVEWGRPESDDHRLFEKLCLEGFQCGLSWITILKRRATFRRAFAEFDPRKVAKFTSAKVDRLLADPGIIRHRGKIESAINNAKRSLVLAQEFGGLNPYFWRWAENRPFPGVLASTPSSTMLSKDLKRRGFTFVGPTTMYAHMQAMGLVNDHLPGCHVRESVQREQDRARASLGR